MFRKVCPTENASAQNFGRSVFWPKCYCPAISFSALNRSSSISMGVPAASPAASLEVPAAAPLKVGAISSRTAGYRLAGVWAGLGFTGCILIAHAFCTVLISQYGSG